MSITVNGEDQEIQQGETLEDLVVRFLRSNAPRGVAVAVNDEIVPRSRWRATPLTDQSRIEIVKITAGG